MGDRDGRFVLVSHLHAFDGLRRIICALVDDHNSGSAAYSACLRLADCQSEALS